MVLNNNKKIQSVRLDDRTMLQIRELAELTHNSPSIVIRALIRRAINEITDDEGNFHLGLQTTMRNRLRRHLNSEILKRIGTLYDDLWHECLGFDKEKVTDEQEDIFQDTIIQVASDNIDPKMSNADFTAHFIKRFNMVRFQTVQDRRQGKEDNYADYT